MIRLTLLIAAFILTVVLISVGTTLLLVKDLGYVRFVPEPRAENPDYGFFQVSGSRFYQVWTTTEITSKGTPPGAHLHAIDIRGEK